MPVDIIFYTFGFFYKSSKHFPLCDRQHGRNFTQIRDDTPFTLYTFLNVKCMSLVFVQCVSRIENFEINDFFFLFLSHIHTT